MTPSQRFRVLLYIATVALAVPLVSCMSSKPQSFRLSFLPATPLPAEPISEDAPVIAPVYANSSPDLVHRALAVAPKPLEVDSRIFKAEGRFETGKKLYQQGDIAGARREFDAAVDMLLSTPETVPDRQRLERKLDQMVDTIYRYDLEGLGAGESQKAIVYDKSTLDDILQMTFPTDPNLRPKVKEEIAATVSQLPLEENDTVLSYIHYFSTDRGHRTLVSALRRAGRYRPLIKRVLDEEGVPQELIYLAQAESGFMPRARSYKAAVGMWQFVQFRGREYGLNQTSDTDDRMDPEKATRAAARHLRDLYAMFGDWYLAMAAYNCGPGCVDHAVQRTGFADFWELAGHDALPKQTANYVPLIVAITIMAKNPKDYNLEHLEIDPPLEYDPLEIDCPTHLGLIADAADRPVSEIQDLNPALLKLVAPAGYQLRVPKGTSPAVRRAIDIIPSGHRASWRIHRVLNGETVAEIAHRYSTAAGAITAANRGMADPPEPGDLLAIPTGYPLARNVVHARPASSRRASHRAVAASGRSARSNRGQSAGLSRRSPAGSYRTASVSVKHRSAAN
ncbi:MAG TPA: transglycosylase SLT domain-containing protein [Bryobacteraceae bacterium]